ncbi:hypothetical protein [Mesorhizobium sp. B2-8-9]|uniref:hypothetical protein n=1 Tax=Mesorhizobium sp. B2-8-9 TaxID=2589899 RepID=UPI001128FCA8|nr:hypothetical protein [Mesorhizobium sp. B2-8-9]TPI86360.1 hypothetical protein FJ423_00620 [Mesorhizobium sp. B2-8-9]
MSDPIIYDDPFRLRVQKALAAAIGSVSITGGYHFDLAGKVFRGRDLFGDASDPLPMVSILEPPLPIDQLRSPPLASESSGDWDLLLQGFVKDDPENPTDPAHLLMADVKRRLAVEKARLIPGSAGMSDPFGMGRGQIVNGKAVNSITELKIGPGVVRPPELGVSTKAFFWLGLSMKIVEDISQPFL